MRSEFKCFEVENRNQSEENLNTLVFIIHLRRVRRDSYDPVSTHVTLSLKENSRSHPEVRRGKTSL